MPLLSTAKHLTSQNSDPVPAAIVMVDFICHPGNIDSIFIGLNAEAFFLMSTLFNEQDLRGSFKHKLRIKLLRVHFYSVHAASIAVHPARCTGHHDDMSDEPS
jgi:hypothetical protein